MRRGGSSRRPGPGMGQGVGERDGQEVAGGGLDRHEASSRARLRLASLARKSSRCLARPLAIMKKLN